MSIWLSGKVYDSLPRGPGFKTDWSELLGSVRGIDTSEP